MSLGFGRPFAVAVTIAAWAMACGSSSEGSKEGDASLPATGGRDSGSGAGGTTGGTGSGGAPGGTASGGADASGADAAASGGAPDGGSIEPGPIDCREDGDGTTTLVFVNRCASALTFRGSDIEGATLAPGAFACVDIGTATEELPAKRYWGFVGDDPGGEHHTLAEFTFNTDFNDFDWYNISHVDAHNLPMQIVPVARPDCQTLMCANDFLADCPEVGEFRNAGGDLVACVSPNRDDGNSPVALYFEACDDAYAWSGDDQNGEDPSPVRACAGEDWDITFCPEANP